MTPPVVVDGERLLWRLDELARLTATPGEGVTREAWSRVDVEARDRVAGWMRDAGLHPIVDPAANLIGRSPGVVGRWFASGSHLDTVVHGGHLDGAYGVVAALEAASALHDAGHTMDHGLLVAAFANEEGARGTAGMTGSYACVGGVSDAALDEVDDEGVTVTVLFACVGSIAYSAKTVTDVAPEPSMLRVTVAPTGSPVGKFSLALIPSMAVRRRKVPLVASPSLVTVATRRPHTARSGVTVTRRSAGKASRIEMESTPTPSRVLLMSL